MDVALAFDASLDEVFPTQHYITSLLEHGVRVLLYIGANDWICNWVRSSHPLSRVIRFRLLTPARRVGGERAHVVSDGMDGPGSFRGTTAERMAR